MKPAPKSQLTPLIDALDALESRLPQLRIECPDPGTRMEAFATLADPILDRAVSMDRGHDHDGCWDMASHRITTMLVDAGWIDEAGTVLG